MPVCVCARVCTPVDQGAAQFQGTAEQATGSTVLKDLSSLELTEPL